MSVWLRVVLVSLFICGVLLVAWLWTPVSASSLDEISTRLAPHRHAWYALPMVMLGFIALCLLPVTLLITATGIAFGPVLGPLYAMAGCLASGSIGFAIGRSLGLRRLQRVGGNRITQISRVLKRNGTLAVFFARKVPAPFTLTNVIVGASSVEYRDFIVGTILGMGAFVIGLAGFGYQLTKVLRTPSPATLAGAVLFLSVPLTMAWLINHVLRRARTV